MPATSLRERLTRLGAPPSPRPRPVWLLPRGFEEIATRFGTAVVRQDVIPLPPLEPHPGNVAYLDTETTGLSGGSGTLVFAAAVARPIDCGLRVAQIFLPQPGLEAAFLDMLREELEPADEVATFNGGSFDLPVLRTRWIMARMRDELTTAPHVDLLTLVRALYRHRLESCTLRMVEERVLGYERDDPIPSALVPDAYFSYLHAGSLDVLEAALEHNRLDVISLVHLHSRLLGRLRGDEAGMDAADWLALGRHRFRRGSRADGWRALRNAASFAKGEASATAGLFTTEQLRTLVAVSQRAAGAGFTVSMMFIGLSSTIFFVLFLRSRYLPAALARFGIVSSPLLVAAAVAMFVFPERTNELKLMGVPGPVRWRSHGLSCRRGRAPSIRVVLRA